MKRITFYLFLLFSVETFADNWEFNISPVYRHSLKFSSGYFFESNAITNEFAMAYFRNEFLDDAKKDKVSKNLKSLNRFGAGFRNEIRYTKTNDTVFGLPHSFYAFSVVDNYHLNSQFGKDVFELYFRGNKSYAGKKADLGNFIFKQFVYNQFKYTFGHEYKFKDDHFGYTVGLAFNFGRKYYKIAAPHASLFTSYNGEYIDLNADLDIYRSDSSEVSVKITNGIGLATDFSFFWRTKKNNKLTFSFSDLGFIRWNEQSSFTHADTSFRFEGIDVSNIFLLTDTIRDPISLDSSLVEPYLTDREKKPLTSYLPSQWKLNYRFVLVPEKLNADCGIGYFFFTNSPLTESVSLDYRIHEHIGISAKTTYGGFAGIRTGFSLYLLYSRWLLSLYSDQFSEILNKNGKAQGAFLSLSVNF